MVTSLDFLLCQYYFLFASWCICKPSHSCLLDILLLCVDWYIIQAMEIFLRVDIFELFHVKCLLISFTNSGTYSFRHWLTKAYWSNTWRLEKNTYWCRDQMFIAIYFAWLPACWVWIWRTFDANPLLVIRNS